MIRTVIIPSMTGELEVIPGLAAAAADDPVRRLVAAWLLGYQSPATRRAYAADMTAWLAFCAGLGTGPLQARRVHADAWARAQQAAGAAPRTAARRLAAVSSWYQYLDGENIRAGSPLEHARRPAVPDRGETPGLTRGELRRLLAAAREHGSPRSTALLELLAHTGLRIGEALSRDVRHLAHDRGHRILRLARKGGRGDRTILTAPVTRALEDYLDGRADGPLFTTRTGARMGQPEAWKMTRRLAARAGLRDRRADQPALTAGRVHHRRPRGRRPPRGRPGRRRARRPPHHPPVRPRPPLPGPPRRLRPHHLARRTGLKAGRTSGHSCSSRAGTVLPDRVLEQHATARTGPDAFPGLVIAGLRHGDRPPGPQPQEPQQLRPASRITRVVHRQPVLRQEGLPLAIGQRAEDAPRVGRILPRRTGRHGRHAPSSVIDWTATWMVTPGDRHLSWLASGPGSESF